MLAAVARALNRPGEIPFIRGAFEQMLRRMIPVRSLRLREAATQWAGRSDGIESIVLEVPGPDGSPKGVLEATFDPGCRLGDWDFQMLGVAAHLGALVLEVERNRAQLVRAGLLPAAARPREDDRSPIVGDTPVMQALRTAVDRVAATDFTVLLEGESGVGKELIARQIHEQSRRRSGPFVAVNCAAIVETLVEAELFGIEERTATGVRGRRGKFEHADGGTLFLDEVSDLSPTAQAKLLRAIQDLAVERVGATGSHAVDIRIVAATNRSLADLVEKRLFRADLYYRLSGVDVRVPSLRERRDDILPLANYFLERHRSTRELTLSASAAEALVVHNWPGNVRELQRVIERAIALADTDSIEITDLPLSVTGDYATALVPSLERRDSLRVWAARYARLALTRSHGNKRAASRLLGISYHTLQAYLRVPIAGESEPAGDDEMHNVDEGAAELCTPGISG
jgi:transcriptional regulator with PAS, ATPase and Fis domain